MQNGIVDFFQSRKSQCPDQIVSQSREQNTFSSNRTIYVKLYVRFTYYNGLYKGGYNH